MDRADFLKSIKDDGLDSDWMHAYERYGRFYFEMPTLKHARAFLVAMGISVPLQLLRDEKFRAMQQRLPNSGGGSSGSRPPTARSMETFAALDLLHDLGSFHKPTWDRLHLPKGVLETLRRSIVLPSFTQSVLRVLSNIWNVPLLPTCEIDRTVRGEDRKTFLMLAWEWDLQLWNAFEQHRKKDAIRIVLDGLFQFHPRMPLTAFVRLLLHAAFCHALLGHATQIERRLAQTSVSVSIDPRAKKPAAASIEILGGFHQEWDGMGVALQSFVIDMQKNLRHLGANVRLTPLSPWEFPPTFFTKMYRMASAVPGPVFGMEIGTLRASMNTWNLTTLLKKYHTDPTPEPTQFYGQITSNLAMPLHKNDLRFVYNYASQKDTGCAPFFKDLGDMNFLRDAWKAEIALQTDAWLLTSDALLAFYGAWIQPHGFSSSNACILEFKIPSEPLKKTALWTLRTF